jgi:hypothetical protein
MAACIRAQSPDWPQVGSYGANQSRLELIKRRYDPRIYSAQNVKISPVCNGPQGTATYLPAKALTPNQLARGTTRNGRSAWVRGMPVRVLSDYAYEEALPLLPAAMGIVVPTKPTRATEGRERWVGGLRSRISPLD